MDAFQDLGSVSQLGEKGFTLSSWSQIAKSDVGAHGNRHHRHRQRVGDKSLNCLKCLTLVWSLLQVVRRFFAPGAAFAAGFRVCD